MILPVQLEAIAIGAQEDRERAWQRDSLVSTVLSSGYSVWIRPMSTVLKLERTLVHWLTWHYYRRSLRTAVATAYTGFALHYPEWVATLFDDHFVDHHLLPMLLAASEEGACVTPEQVAERFASQLSVMPSARARYSAAVMPAAIQFLQMVAAALADARMATPVTPTPMTIDKIAPLDLPVLG